MKRLREHAMFAFAWLLGLAVIIVLATVQVDDTSETRVNRTVIAESEPKNHASLWAENMPRTYYNRRGVAIPPEETGDAKRTKRRGARTGTASEHARRSQDAKGSSLRGAPLRPSTQQPGPERPKVSTKTAGVRPSDGLRPVLSAEMGDGNPRAENGANPMTFTGPLIPMGGTGPTPSHVAITPPPAATKQKGGSPSVTIQTPRQAGRVGRAQSQPRLDKGPTTAPAASTNTPGASADEPLTLPGFVPDRIETDWTQDHAPSPPSNARRKRILSGTLFARETNPNVIGILDGHLEMIQALRFSPGGFALQSVSEDGEVWVWDTSSGRALRRLLPKEGSASLAADVAPDREVMVTYNCTVTPCRVRLRDMRDPTRAMGIDTKHHAISTITLGPRGRTMVIASHDGRVTVHHATTGALEQVLPTPGRGVWAVALDEGTKWVATAGIDRRVRIWDRARGRMRHALKGHRAPINVVRFSHNGRVLASGGADGEVRLWNPRTGRLLRTLKTDVGAVHALAFERSGGALAAGGDRGLQIWDATTYEEEALFPWVFGITALAFSPDNTTLAAGDVEGLVVLWDVHFGARLHRPFRQGPREARYRRSTIACLSFSACSEGLKPVSM